ncbi:Photosystem I PsaK reaction centre protein [Dioscorea alata]|uniref:Photosystem I PsaK reaction centre protein n=1 Tax=Dioscorea alata TaxID=55571 RepID=A0ACB7U9L1_DIOAL|nr:Photosystem I PsaK reaction centre protein [Dioscorea alata]
MSITSSATNNTMAAPVGVAGLLPTPAFGHLITVKLTRENYLLWKAQVLPYLRSQQLLGYIDGSVARPAETIAQIAQEGEVTTVQNPAFTRWLQQDQMVLSALLSSLSNEVLAQVLFLTTSKEVWRALEQMFSYVFFRPSVSIFQTRRLFLTCLQDSTRTMIHW